MPLYIHQHGDTWMFFRLCNLVLEPKIASLRWSNHANPILRGSGSDFNAVGMLNRQPNQCACFRRSVPTTVVAAAQTVSQCGDSDAAIPLGV